MHRLLHTGRSRRPDWRRLASTGLILVVCTALCLLLFVQVRGWERASVRAEINQRGNERAELLKVKVLRSSEVVYGIRAFFAAHPMPTRMEFQAFVQPALQRQPELRALEWVPRVASPERNAYEAAAQADGFRNFQFTQQGEGNTLSRAPESATYFPVFYVEPVVGNRRAAGYDLGSSPQRRATLELARDSGLLRATRPVILAQETGSDPYGFLVVLPIYAGGVTPETTAERQSALRGFALAVFRLSDLIDQCLDPLVASGLSVRIRDADLPAPIYLRASAAPRGTVWWSAPFHPPVARTGTRLPLEIGGRVWDLELDPSPAFVAQRFSWQSWGTLLAGLLLTAGPGAYLLFAARHAEMIEFHVARRTTQLQQARVDLECKVAQRTAELAQSNAFLQVEAATRRHAEESAERANRAKTAFLAMMTHELRTPMNAILGYSQLLARDSQLTPAQGRAVTTIQSAGAHLLGMINEALDLAKIESGRMELAAAPFNLTAMIHGLAAMFEDRAAQKGVRLLLDIPARRMIVLGDEGRLRQVLINLLGNGLKFTDAGHVSLKLHHHQDLFEFRVSDTGPGISPENLERIFEPFRQAEMGLARGGTGLGLAIARDFVALLAGSTGKGLTVSSQPGRGSSFAFAVPLKIVSVEPQPDSADAPGANPASGENWDRLVTSGEWRSQILAAAETCSTTELKHLAAEMPRDMPEQRLFRRALENRIEAFDYPGIRQLIEDVDARRRVQ